MLTAIPRSQEKKLNGRVRIVSGRDENVLASPVRSFFMDWLVLEKKVLSARRQARPEATHARAGQSPDHDEH